MQGVYVILGLMVGVMLYRWGRKEGERGRVMPLIPSKPKAPRAEQQLLQQIESYDGTRKKEEK